MGSSKEEVTLRVRRESHDSFEGTEWEGALSETQGQEYIEKRSKTMFPKDTEVNKRSSNERDREQHSTLRDDDLLKQAFFSPSDSSYIHHQASSRASCPNVIVQGKQTAQIQ